MMNDSLSQRPRLRFWGWGRLDQELSPEERDIVAGIARYLGVSSEGWPGSPRLEEFELPAPRVRPPVSLEDSFSRSAYDRLTHSYGKSYADCVRMWQRSVPHPPDWVAFPQDEQAVVDILDWASRANVAVIPFGGGSSVCGGVEPAVGTSYVGTVSLDMERLNRVTEVDRVSRAARIQGGALGPDLEAQLRPYGLSLRFYPQSFQFSTLGGWIATRAGGHYATMYTHIEDFVESTRTVTPGGVLETRRLPGSGAGPSPDRLIAGSEGTLGVITEAWMKLQDRPRFRASASVRFEEYGNAVNCVRALSQSGLHPANCRLLDPAEVAFAGVGDRRSPTLVLAFESSDHELRAWMARALELAADYGGEFDAQAVERSMRTDAREPSDEHRRGDAGAWREAFVRMPYWRDPMVGMGIIIDTFESAITWDQFDTFYHGVRADVERAILDATGRHASVSCRFTHVYPDGPAPYFTYSVLGRREGDLAGSLAAWRDIKLAANAAVTRHGGTVTHQRAVGRDQRSGYEQQSSPLCRAALTAVKARLDPSAILNPGVLIDPPGHPLGVTGALQARA